MGNLTLPPREVWKQVRREMDEKHFAHGWYGLNKNSVCARVRRVRGSMNFGDAFCTVENTSFAMMQDTDRPFLQHHSVIPDRTNPGVWQRLMVFGNPTLFGLLMAVAVDLYIDATFDCCPNPFYQCLIIMCFDRATSMYVPVLYCLMTHKTQELYWHALNQVIVISNWKLKVRSYTTDFEKAIINSCEHQFPEGFHVGCFFHLKQAWRRYLITKCGFLREEISLAMMRGVLDILTILPFGDIEPFGIPYVRSVVEEGVSAENKKKWDRFWEYFASTWLGSYKVTSWNICGQDNKYKELMNRTNNGLERYNKRFNGLFDGRKPTLLEFVQIVESESREQAQMMDDVRRNNIQRAVREETSIPHVPSEYHAFKKAVLQKKRARKPRKQHT